MECSFVKVSRHMHSDKFQRRLGFSYIIIVLTFYSIGYYEKVLLIKH